MVLNRYVEYHRKLIQNDFLKLFEFFTRAAFAGGYGSGEVSGRVFYVLRQFCITKFVNTCYPEAPEDVNVRNICQLIMHQLVKREKAVQEEECDDDDAVSTPNVKPTLKRKQSSGSRKSKPKSGRAGTK